MAVFGKHVNSLNTQTTIISNSVYIKGEIKSNSIIHVDGFVDGTLNSDNTIIIGKSGNIKGKIFSPKVVISGNFEGNIDADSVELLEGANVKGDILSRNLSIESGARFSGRSLLKDEGAKAIEMESVAILEDNSAS